MTVESDNLRTKESNLACDYFGMVIFMLLPLLCFVFVSVFLGFYSLVLIIIILLAPYRRSFLVSPWAGITHTSVLLTPLFCVFRNHLLISRDGKER